MLEGSRPAPDTLEVWHTLPADEVASRMRTEPERGLSRAEAVRRLEEHGANALVETRGRSALAIVVGQFRSLIVALLLAATAVALALGDSIEAAAILVVIILNALIGFLTEWKAEQALTALRKQTLAVAQVIRDGEEHQVSAAAVVPGDVAVLAAGVRVPADGRVITSVELRVEEAALTGESRPVAKLTQPIPDADAPVADRRSMVFMGTTVTDGRGRMIVTATGMHTEVGRIGTLIDEAGDQDTPLERKLAQVGRVLVGIVLALGVVIVLAGWLRGNQFLYMLEVGISLAIAAVPEGLLAVATMTLALGMQRMAEMRVLVRRLPAVETLGSTTVICTDKTGTLTQNEMTVRALQLGERRVEITGSGYAVSGEFRVGGQRVDPESDDHLILALRIGVLCGDAKIDRVDGRAVVLGDPTEAALIVAAAKAGLEQTTLNREQPRVGEVPFSSEAKRMMTIHRTPEGNSVAYVKGAPGVVLEASGRHFTRAGERPLAPEDRERFMAINEELGGRALRVLALAYRVQPIAGADAELARDLVFVGLVAMIDPLRDEAASAIVTCRQAGIRTMMITGDQPATAAEIGRELGLDRDPQGRRLKTVHGRDLAALDGPGWRRVVASASVFARVSPEHKLRIVDALQSQGEIVAMTGDGVNDAPALKQADIGVAMGIKGTEVAKEAADMIITDDNFATIVVAVEQGRIVYANIIRFIHYLFSCNFSEIVVVFTAIMIGWPLPLGPLQILWLNMITDVFPAMALALEPSDPDAMKQPPRDPRQPLMNTPFVGLIVWQGLLLAGVTLTAFFVGMRWYGTEGTGLRHAVTMGFMTLAVAQIFHAFNARSRRQSMFIRPFANAWLATAVLTCVILQLAAVYWPFLGLVLNTVPLSSAELAVVAACSLAPVAVVEIVKVVQRKAGAHAS
ncbi:MAG: cation-translocating P-type ATPase [Candidatus Rokuibacteriota bacterium]